MDALDMVLAGVAALSAAAAGIAVLLERRRTARVLRSLDRMVDAAMRGDLRETVFDESLLSAVETRLAHYLAASAVSARNLAEEKNKISELVGDISHQTRTPVANILLYAQLLNEQDLPEQSRACVRALCGQAEKLRFLIDALVKTSRLEAGILALRPEQQEIWPMLERVTQQAAPKAKEKNIELRAEPTEEKAVFDLRWTAEALYNLVDNAVKYTPAGGRVVLAVTPYELFCRIDVTDTGMGVPEEEQAKIFGRFYRSRAAGDAEGVGIGLYLARQIVAGEGGYLKVTSRVGSGSTFSVFLRREL